MTHAIAPPPALAYVARITPRPLDAPNVRAVRLSARQHEALNGLQVPITLTSPSPHTPTRQAELAIGEAVHAVLGGTRDVSVLLWQDDAGDVSVRCVSGLLPIAAVEVTLARQEVAA